MISCRLKSRNLNKLQIINLIIWRNYLLLVIDHILFDIFKNISKIKITCIIYLLTFNQYLEICTKNFGKKQIHSQINIFA